MNRDRHRRGAYAILLAVLAAALLGITAFAINVPWITSCRAEATAVTEAAARAGARVLRRTGDTTQAATAIQAIAAANTVCDAAPDTPTVTWGRWDETGSPPAFTPSASPADAVQVTLGRTSGNAVTPLWQVAGGPTSVDVGRTLVATVRGTHVVFVVDVLPHWTESEAILLRDALTAALARLGAVASERDRVSLVLFAGPYAWTWTSTTDLATAGAPAALAASWADLRIASRAGSQGAGTDADGIDCTVHTGSSVDDFTSPSGGCYPTMPRLYADELGLDPSVGLTTARSLFAAVANPSEARAIVLVAAGDPASIGSSAGTARATDGYVEVRFPETVGSIPQTAADAATSAIAVAENAWADDGAHVFAITLDAASTVYPSVIQGRGTYVDLVDPADLDDALFDALGALPVGVVP